MSGILDFEVVFPRSSAKVQDMHAESGVDMAEILAITHCEEFPALGEGEQAWELALAAAVAVLGRAGVPRSAIGQVIYAGSGEWDIPFWSPAAKVAHELGIDRAHCFEVVNFCNALTAAVRVACDDLDLGRSEYTLVLTGDRLSRLVDYGDPDSKALFNFGDAGAAVLLGRGAPVFKMLHSAMRTDPGWSDYYAGERRPDRVTIRRQSHREGLAAAYVENFAALVAETLSALDRGPEDIAWFLINHGDRSMHEKLLRGIGIPVGKSVFNYDRLGHMGCADTLIALQGLMAEERLRPGDLILLATSAMGFSWGITALECQE
ncbi:3-oxoacyl-ACP synthase III family protein [Amycolatopsis sp. NPDC057786]|uniref:3-oxoacyl-ACP synthase III family protein n=1 Tax=Amycolatopsis sp. NPDC057786 TaxID=3346250 RepID=UPI00366D098F